ncbi:MAG: 50S ribosomal protein L4 [Gammaproteobacteria bacterium]|nr:50S ribosomal protein L4 [Gammaproteobacteria bacterium]
MDLPILSFASGASAGSLAVADDVFAQPYREALVHQIVTAYFNAARAGTKAQKTRAEVSGGGAKPWKQKGMGRARAGTSRGPLWRTGGRAFAARPRSYEQKVNRKMYRGALCSILSELIRQDRLIVVDNLDVQEKKTKALIAALEKFALQDVLLISEEVSEALYLSARNLHWVGLADVEMIDPALLISFAKVVVSQSALTRLQEQLS